MQKQQDALMKRFLGKQKRPKREKSEQSKQQTASLQDYARRAALNALNEKSRQWLERLKAMNLSA